MPILKNHFLKVVQMNMVKREYKLLLSSCTVHFESCLFLYVYIGPKVHGPHFVSARNGTENRALRRARRTQPE